MSRRFAISLRDANAGQQMAGTSETDPQTATASANNRAQRGDLGDQHAGGQHTGGQSQQNMQIC